MHVRKTLASRIFSAIGWVIIGCLCLAVVYMLYCNIAGKTPRFFGYSCMKVVSGSMEPTIPVGSFIIVKQVDTESLEVGDVICFYSQDEYIKGKPNTHRIVEISGEGSQKTFTTKGDANSLKDDATVSTDMIIGEYEKNVNSLPPIVGKLLSNNYFFFIVIMVPAAILFLLEMLNVFRTAKKQEAEEAKEKENEKKAQIPDISDEDLEKALKEYAEKHKNNSEGSK